MYLSTHITQLSGDTFEDLIGENHVFPCSDKSRILVPRRSSSGMVTASPPGQPRSVLRTRDRAGRFVVASYPLQVLASLVGSRRPFSGGLAP